MTSSITWTPQLPPIDADPDDVKDIVFDFTDWLGEDTINEAGTSALADGCSAEVAAVTESTATLRVSGGTEGLTGTATIRLRTNNGRQSDRSLRFRFKQL
jgi:hypothetical protein